MNKNVHSLWCANISLSSKLHKLSTVHVLRVNTYLEHLKGALHGDSNTMCEQNFISFCHANHCTCVHFIKPGCLLVLQSRQTLLAAHPWMTCTPSTATCLLFLAAHDLVESAGCLHSHLLSYMNLSLS